MNEHTLSDQLQSLHDWQAGQRQALSELAPWLKEQKLFTTDMKQGLLKARRALQTDEVTVAVVGEFSRGKTELINSLFFADFGRRLLPTDAGRTTMCPLEIIQDNELEPSLRLLPIESRKEETSLADLRKTPDKWLTLPLDLKNPAELERKLKEMAAVRKVPRTEAMALGLYKPENGQSSPNEIEIPRWRQAILNYRHPMLARGLRILDTPGLNALGSEPELTYELLPQAQAILFVLGADTGVTQSDQIMFKEHVLRAGGKKPEGLIVVLNKVDTLWDDLRNPHSIEDSIRRQRRETARTLGVSEHQVLACSAQKALLARVKDDASLERRSGIVALEKEVATSLADQRMALLQRDATEELLTSLSRIEAVIRARLSRAKRQTQTLNQLSGRSENALATMMDDVKYDKRRYFQSVAALKLSRQEFRKRGEDLMAALDPATVDNSANEARKKMLGAWTTIGLQEVMKTLFDNIEERMKEASSLAHAMRRTVRSIYKRFQTEHEFELPPPPLFSIVKHQVELGLLHQEAEVFRKSPRTALTEQHFVVKRYYKTLITRARKIFREANKEAQMWLDSALDPLVIQAKEHRQMLARQVQDLKDASHSRSTVNLRLTTLAEESEHLQEQVQYLSRIRQSFQQPIAPPASHKGTAGTKPYLVRSRA